MLGFDIEQELESWLLRIVRRGAPIPVDGLCYSVQYLCRKKKLKTPFTDDCPGRKWIAGFFRRHPVLSVKKSEYLSHQRALLTEAAVRFWFTKVREQFEEEGLDLSILDAEPSRIFNLDEAAIYTNPSGKLFVIYRRN